jgi:hypothetical protein
MIASIAEAASKQPFATRVIAEPPLFFPRPWTFDLGPSVPIRLRESAEAASAEELHRDGYSFAPALRSTGRPSGDDSRRRWEAITRGADTSPRH